MQLSPQEVDKLVLHQAGTLAQRRLARGVRLNVPEVIALVATVVLELARDGRSVAECMALGRTLLGRRQVMPGVEQLVHDVQVEATFRDGTKLVTVHAPVTREDGDLGLALHGSFFPVPPLSAFDAPAPAGRDGPLWLEAPAVGEPTDPSGAFDAVGAAAPGEVWPAPGEIELNAGRPVTTLEVQNLLDRPIQVGSHYPFLEANRALRFDRRRAYGKRLDIPAGTAVRFEPGETKTVRLVPIAGAQVILGGNDLTDGPTTPERVDAVMARVTAGGFADAPEGES